MINSGCTSLDFLFDRRLEPDEMDSDEEEEEDDDFDFRYLYHTLLKIYLCSIADTDYFVARLAVLWSRRRDLWAGATLRVKLWFTVDEKEKL